MGAHAAGAVEPTYCAEVEPYEARGRGEAVVLDYGRRGRGAGVYYYCGEGGEGTEGGSSEMLLLECDCGLDNIIPDFLLRDAASLQGQKLD